MDNSKYAFLLNAGHGGFNPDGVYTTAPNKMFNHPNEDLHNPQGDIFEGIANRSLCNLISALAYNEGFQVINIHNQYKDISLYSRSLKVNNYYSYNKKCILLDIHFNSAPKHNAKGWEIFSYNRNTKSVVLAEYIAERAIAGDLHIRRDHPLSDTKTANFYMLKKTKPFAVTIESGFFDNKEEARKMVELGLMLRWAYVIFEGSKKFMMQHL